MPAERAKDRNLCAVFVFVRMCMCVCAYVCDMDTLTTFWHFGVHVFFVSFILCFLFSLRLKYGTHMRVFIQHGYTYSFTTKNGSSKDMSGKND